MWKIKDVGIFRVNTAILSLIAEHQHRQSDHYVKASQSLVLHVVCPLLPLPHSVTDMLELQLHDSWEPWWRTAASDKLLTVIISMCYLSEIMRRPVLCHIWI